MITIKLSEILGAIETLCLNSSDALKGESGSAEPARCYGRTGRSSLPRIATLASCCPKSSDHRGMKTLSISSFSALNATGRLQYSAATILASL